MKCIGVGHLEYRLPYAIVILGVGDSKVLTCGEKIIKREGGRGQGVVAIAWGDDDTGSRAKAAVTWAMVGRMKSGFIDM